MLNNLKDEDENTYKHILTNCVEHMNIFFEYKTYMIQYTNEKERWFIPFNIIKYALYTACWFYILTYAL